MKKKIALLLTTLIMSFTFFGCSDSTNQAIEQYLTDEFGAWATEYLDDIDIDEIEKVETPEVVQVSDIPEFSDVPFVELNNGEPTFTEKEITTDAYEYYGDLDELGRCTITYACVGKELMPTEKRGSIGSVRPTGWINKRYDFVDGKYLYNRCHLLGYQLTGENANELNLITGTRYMNVEGMLPFENMIADYIKETGNHVMYRVKPIFEGDNLLASGVQMEALSVEDGGEAICFNVYVYNVQPGVIIDYETGMSYEE